MAIKQTGAQRAPRRDAADHQFGIASQVLAMFRFSTRRSLSGAPSGDRGPPVRIGKGRLRRHADLVIRGPGIPDRAAFLRQNLTLFLPDVSPYRRRGDSLTKKLPGFVGHGIS